MSEDDDIYCPHLGPPNEKAWCPKCNGRDDGDARVAKIEASTVEVIFTARYQGRCTRCADEIFPGDRVARLGNGDYICDQCRSKIP